MAEFEHTLGRSPDNAASRLPQGDSPLFLAGMQDFNTAIDLVSSVGDYRVKNRFLLTIAQEQAQAGLTPYHSPDFFEVTFEPTTHHVNNDILGGIALLKAYTGDVPGAIETAKLTDRSPRFYTGLAKAIAAQGEDTQPIFDQIYRKLGSRSIDDMRNAARVAQTQRELGLTPPKATFDQFRKHATDNVSNIELTNAYAIAGFPDDALEVWGKTTDPLNTGYTQRAEALSAVALSYAREGADPSEVIVATIDLTEALRPSEGYYPGWKQAEIYATLAQAVALTGEDPQHMVDRALQKALEDPTNLRADAYTEIAKAQVSFGADAKPTLALALACADDVVKLGEEKVAYIVTAGIQMLNWEDIFEVQLEGNYFDDARTTLGRLDRYPDQESSKIELFAKLGRAQILAAAA